MGGGGQNDGMKVRDFDGITFAKKIRLVLFSPIQNSSVVLQSAASFTLQIGEDLREEMRVGVDAQHLGTGDVDNGQTTVPECLFSRLHQEGLERVRDLVPHVGVRQVQAG